MAYLELGEVKKHLTVDFEEDNDRIEGLIDLVEELVLTEIQGTIDGEGTVTTAVTKALVGVGTYFTNFTPGDTIKVEGETIRTIDAITDDTHLTVTVAFVATASGLGYITHPGIPNPIPKGLKQAMLLLAEHFYTFKGVVIVGVTANEIPYLLKYLFAPWKHYTIS